MSAQPANLHCAADCVPIGLPRIVIPFGSGLAATLNPALGEVVGTCRDRGTLSGYYPSKTTLQGGEPLFRQVRDDLTKRGFSVAARPLPAGMTIRGSPMGTQSAAK